MSTSTRLAWGVGVGVVIYTTGLFLVPSLGPIEEMIKTTVVSSANVTQTVYFVLSMALMLIIGRGKLGQFGFRLSGFKPLGWAILISAMCEVGFLIVMMFSVSLFAPDLAMQGEAGQMAMSFPEAIISVWLIASICEELLFRGLIYGILAPFRERGFKFLGKHVSLPVIVAALMFGLGHLCLLSLMPPIVVANILLATTTCGCVAGYFRETSGSLIPAIASHMTFNIVGMTIPMLMGAGM